MKKDVFEFELAATSLMHELATLPFRMTIQLRDNEIAMLQQELQMQRDFRKHAEQLLEIYKKRPTPPAPSNTAAPQ